jgi:hypothetical protein
VSQRFGYIDYAKTATPTSSADATGYPKENALNDARWKRWRSSTTAGNQNYDIDFGSSKTIQYVALVDAVGHTGGTVKAQYWTGAVWTDLGTFTFSTLTGVGIVWANQSTTKIRILFTNSGAVSSFVDIGTVRCGGYFQPTAQIQPGVSLIRTDPSQAARSIDGQEFIQRRSLFSTFNGVFRPMEATDRNTFSTMFETVGRFQPFFYALDHSNMDQCLYAKFDVDLALGHVVPSANLWYADVSLREAL